MLQKDTVDQLVCLLVVINCVTCELIAVVRFMDDKYTKGAKLNVASP